MFNLFLKKSDFSRYFIATTVNLFAVFITSISFSFASQEKIAVSENVIFQKSALNKKSFFNSNQSLKKDTLIVGGGCFWCMEAIFLQTKGVISVTSGYSGGIIANPSYEDVCSGQTGHAEVIQIIFDVEKVSMYDLLQIFFSLHDPTTLNQQGADKGEQYRSVIFYRTKKQKEIATSVIKRLDAEHIFESKIVTDVAAFKSFYPAEDYHQNYYNRNKNKGYCRAVILPKLEKFDKLFMKLKKKG